jgi:uncharacterized membrane-anchored protein YhcB (DUF1043 family)
MMKDPLIYILITGGFLFVGTMIGFLKSLIKAQFNSINAQFNKISAKLSKIEERHSNCREELPGRFADKAFTEKHIDELYRRTDRHDVEITKINEKLINRRGLNG